MVVQRRRSSAGNEVFRAAANPWGEGATTLEWHQPSPSPYHTYEELPKFS